LKKGRIIYVWNYREWGGAQIYFLSLMKAAKGKYDVSAMLPADSDRTLLDYLDSIDVPYEFLDQAPSMLGARGIAGRVRRRYDLWRSESALVDRIAGKPGLENTIVHIDMGFWQSFRPLYRLSKLTNVVMTLHTAMPPAAGLRSLIWRLKGRLIGRRPRLHLMASNEDAKKGITPYIPAGLFDAIKVAHSGFEPEEIGAVRLDADAVRSKLGIDAGSPLIVTSAQFIERKGCWTVLKALRILKNNGVKFTFLWLGTSTSAGLSQRLDEYGLGSSFRLLSPEDIGPNRGDVLSIVAAADIFVLASTQEGLPISLVEAMALGRACIATRVGAIPEALGHERNGLLIEPNDDDALAAAVKELVFDPAKRELLGRAAAATAIDRFDAARSAQKVVKFYDSLWQT